MAALPHDSSGFLVGERLVSGIDLVGKDTAEILKILRASFGLQVISNNRLRVTLDRINNKLSSPTIDVTPTPSPVPRLGNGNGNSGNANPLPTVDVGAPPDNRPMPPTRELGDPPPDSSSDPAPVPPDTANPPPSNEPSGDGGNAAPPDVIPPDDGRRNNGRRRNSRGQFEGDGLTDEERKRKAEEAAKAKAEKEANDNLKKSIMEGISLGNTDTHNIDPTVDAVRELGDLMSPLAKVGKTMFKGAAWLFRRKKKREEPSDQEQRQQSRIEKLLKRIAGSRVGQAAGSGFNLFGGLFSSLTGTVGGALRFIPALISSIFSPIASVFRVVPSLIMGAIAPIGRVLTSLAPMLIRFLPIALGVTAAFKLGEWVGGKIYEAIGPKLGEAIDWTVDAVKAIPDKISKAWDGVIDIASKGIESVVDGVKGLKNKVVGAYDATVNSAANGMSNVADFFKSKAKPTALSKTSSKNQLMVYNAFKNSGMSDAQAKAMTAEVGRENDYKDKFLYGKHTDDKNGITNQGMFSWQKDRRTKLVDFMQKRGLVDKDGNFAKGQESLNAQAAFAKSEIDSGKYEKTRQFFASNPNANQEQAAQVLGRDYVGWRIDDPKYAANGNARRRGYLASLEQQLSKGDVSHVAAVLPTMPAVNNMVNTPLDSISSGLANSVNTKTFSPAIPMSVPKLLARPMPEVPKQKQQVSTKEQKPMQVSVVGGNEAISQNLSDRHLAHVVTGGLGMDALRHS